MKVLGSPRRRLRHRRVVPNIALVLAVAGGLLIPAPLAWAESGSITNLGLATSSLVRTALGGGRLAFGVSEAHQGIDRNADGDTIDDVAAVWDPASNITTDLGLAVFSSFAFVALGGGRFAFAVSEFAQGGVDRNGDGDATDNVAAVWDPATNTTTNLGLGVVYIGVPLDGGRLAVSVSEIAQGGVDRNGDGDATDSVAAVWDPTTNTTTNLGLAAVGGPLFPGAALAGGRLAFPVAETDQGGADRNGDGDATDSVAAVWDPTTKTITNLGLSGYDLLGLGGGRLSFFVWEAEEGVDRNGDGDTTDSVAAVWNPATNATTNLGLAAGHPFGTGSVAFGGGRFAFFVGEATQGGIDRNGDGDATDFVVTVWDPATSTTNLGLASTSDPSFVTYLTPVALEGDRLAVFVDESHQSAADRNGDGDATDFVVAVWNPATNMTTNLGLAASFFDVIALQGGRLAVYVSEIAQGAVDRNGDGDATDSVAAVWNSASNTTTNLGLADGYSTGRDSARALEGGRLAVSVWESDQGGSDRNGDGDATDSVVAVWDPATNTTANLGLADSLNGIALGGGRLGFNVSEAAQGGLDRNGDGDSTDTVGAVWDPAPATDTAAPDTSTTSRPETLTGDTTATFAFTGADDVSPAAALRFECSLDGSAYAWCTSPRQYADLNGGGHTFAVRAVDQAGNPDPTPAIWTWTVDETDAQAAGAPAAISDACYASEGSITVSVTLAGWQPGIGFSVANASPYEWNSFIEHDVPDASGNFTGRVTLLHYTGGTIVGPAPNPGSLTLTVFTDDPNSNGNQLAGPFTVVVPSCTTAPPTVRSGYWMVGSDGEVYAFGDAVSYGNAATSSAVDLEPTRSGNGYLVVDDLGRVFAFGDAVGRGNVDGSTLVTGEKTTSLSATRSGNGYWIFTNRGRALTFGDALFYGDMSKTALNGPVLDSISTSSGNGYYMVASDGGIFAFGDAAFYGSMGGEHLNAPVQSLVPSPSGLGYWLVASDGGIFAFGDAPFLGSMGNTQLNKPVTGMVRSGNGYLMVGEDGGIFDFSGTPDGFKGSLGGNPPANPIVSVAVLQGL